MAVIFQVNGGGGDNEIEVTDEGVVNINGVDVTAVVSDPAAFIADPVGAATDQDDEARAAIGSILDLLIAKGLMESS